MEHKTAVPEHLNSSGCRIGYSEGKGRGVYATRTIPSQTVIEISPTLLFSKEEYERYGKYTILDHYALNWQDGRMALALGLGSLFNHSEAPNVSFSLDVSTDSIRYTTTRTINLGEELCIFYGHHLWFEPAPAAVGSTTTATVTENRLASPPPSSRSSSTSSPTPDTEESPLPSTPPTISHPIERNPFTTRDPSSIIPESNLPFARTRVIPEDDDKEDTEGSIKTIKVWAVDVPEMRALTKLLKWVKDSGLETDDLSHLKRVRRDDLQTTLLLTASPDAPVIPDDFQLRPPYLVEVPASAALTPISHKLKLQLWPTVYAPKRKGEPDKWSRAKAAWAWEAVETLYREAERARAEGELPIIAYVPTPFKDDVEGGAGSLPPFIGRDTRKSTNHPLRHAVIDVIRKVAEWRAKNAPPRSLRNPNMLRSMAQSSPSSVPSSASTSKISLPLNSTENIANGYATNTSPSSPTPSCPNQSTTPSPSTNGLHYLLTSLTLFTTHEPCLMCSMALLHSRVRLIVFLVPMPQTGGCGGADGLGTCVPRLKGVNHRFGIGRWKASGGEEEAIEGTEGEGTEREEIRRLREDVEYSVDA